MHSNAELRLGLEVFLPKGERILEESIFIWKLECLGEGIIKCISHSFKIVQFLGNNHSERVLFKPFVKNKIFSRIAWETGKSVILCGP